MKKLITLSLILFAMLNGKPVAAQQSQENEKTKPVLIVIDVQKAFIGMMDQAAIDGPIEYINAYIGAFNQLGYPVIYVQHAAEEYGVAVGTETFEFIDEIPVPEDALKIIKTYGNSFTKTNLDEILKKSGCNTLFLCGLSASGCVFSTWVGGQDHDYKTYILKDAVMSHDHEVTKMIEEITGAINSNAMQLLLENI